MASDEAKLVQHFAENIDAIAPAFVDVAALAQVGETEAKLIFLRISDGTVLTIHRPNHHGDVTEAAALAAFDAAEIEPPVFDVHWCD